MLYRRFIITKISHGKKQPSRIGIIYGYKTDGLFVDQAEIDNAPDQLISKSGIKPGYVKYKDISGPDGVPDGKVDAQYDRTVLGSTTPKFYYGLNLTATYKGFDFTALFQGLGGHKRLIGSYMAYAFYMVDKSKDGKLIIVGQKRIRTNGQSIHAWRHST